MCTQYKNGVFLSKVTPKYGLSTFSIYYRLKREKDTIGFRQYGFNFYDSQKKFVV